MRDLRAQAVLTGPRYDGAGLGGSGRRRGQGGRLCSHMGCFRPTTHLKPYCIHHIQDIPAVQEVLARWRWLKSPVVQRLVRSLHALREEPFSTTDLAERLGVVDETAARYLDVLERLGAVYRERGCWHYCGL